MARLTLSAILGACVVAWCAPATATAYTYSFHPSPSDLSDLDHSKYYTWGISWSVPANEFITGVTLFIDGLNDWQVENDDLLYIHLLDDPSLGVHSWTDNEGNGDAFLGQGLLLTTYTDDDGPPNPAEDWSYSFTYPTQTSELNSYTGNGRWGLGFDPDCHYYNCGVTLKVYTACVPEPGAALAMLSAGGLLALRRRH